MVVVDPFVFTTDDQFSTRPPVPVLVSQPLPSVDAYVGVLNFTFQAPIARGPGSGWRKLEQLWLWLDWGSNGNANRVSLKQFLTWLCAQM